MHPHLSGDVGQDLVTVLELDPEHRVRQCFEDLPLKLDDIFFAQKRSLQQYVRFAATIDFIKGRVKF